MQIAFSIAHRARILEVIRAGVVGLPCKTGTQPLVNTVSTCAINLLKLSGGGSCPPCPYARYDTVGVSFCIILCSETYCHVKDANNKEELGCGVKLRRAVTIEYIMEGLSV